VFAELKSLASQLVYFAFYLRQLFTLKRSHTNALRGI
jgi:hypothetical protein